MEQKTWMELDDKELQKVSGGDGAENMSVIWRLLDKFFAR